jgi:hypothetical protein
VSEQPASFYGLLAEFEDHHQLLTAAREAYAAGYRTMDAFSPFPIEGLAENLGRQKTAIPLIVLIGGLLGGSGGYFMQWYAMTVSYPINVGGRPFHSWPAFIPITFELTILCAALSGVIGMLALNRLPRPHHPLFAVPGFERAMRDRFFLCIESCDVKFDPAATRSFLESLHPLKLTEVAP